jgi:hypothetical protein
MAFSNRIRLPIQLHSAQFPEERQVFRKANGQSKTLSVVIRKTYELETDYMPEKWHQRLKIALSHDNITLEGEHYIGGISQDGDYNIDWVDTPLHYPTAKGGTKVQVTPFDATNSNCQSCEAMSQLSLVDDEATGLYGSALEEDTDYTVPAPENDSICCYPAIFSITSYNSDYLTSCTIDPDTGIISIHTGTSLVAVNGLKIATYRVTCPDGSYDEADVYADINGTVEGCLAPTGLSVIATGPSDLLATWTETIPGSTYYWEVYAGSMPVGSPIQTGSVTDDEVTVTGLNPDTEYYFQVQTTCEETSSNFIGQAVITSESSSSCGRYTIEYNNPSLVGATLINYTDCDGNEDSILVSNHTFRFLCVLQNSPGDPVNLTTTNPFVTITYSEEC